MEGVLATADSSLWRFTRPCCRCTRRSRHRRCTYFHHFLHAPHRRRPRQTILDYARYRYCRRYRLGCHLRAPHGTHQRMGRYYHRRRKFRPDLSYRELHACHRHRRPHRRRHRQLRPGHRLSPRIHQRLRLRHHGRNVRLHRAILSPLRFWHLATSHPQGRQPHSCHRRASRHCRHLWLDPRASRRQHHGHDWPRPRHWYYFAAPLLWRHQHVFFGLRFRPRFAIFVLY